MRPTVRTYALLAALYFAQGLPFGFQQTALPVYLRASGVSLVGIGFVGMLALPWSLKALWAPLVDRFGSRRFGRRRSWLLPMQLGLTAAAAAASAFAMEQRVGPLLVLLLLMNLFAATQDIAVDGLAVDLIGGAQLGPANAIQVVGYKVGMLAGGGLLVAASAWVGWEGTFFGMALCCAGVLVAVLGFQEPPAAKGVARDWLPLSEVLARVVAAVRLPGAGWVLLFIGTYKLGESMIDVMFKPFLVDARVPEWKIGLWMGTYGMVASLLGSVAGGALTARLGLWRALALTSAARILPLAGEWLISLRPLAESTVIAVTVAEHFFGGAVTTAMFAFMMSRVDRRIGATHFTLLASVELVGKSPSAWASGLLVQGLGYSSVFALGTALSVAFLALLLPLRRVPTPALT